MEKGNASLALGDYEMAQEFYSGILRKDPLNSDARLGMGKAILQRISAENSSDSLLWIRAVTHLEAARTINSSLEVNGLLSQVWQERAFQLLAKDDTIEALSALTRAIEHDSRNMDALNQAGIIYFRLGEVGKAKAIFQKALICDSLSSSVLFNLGMVNWQERNTAVAHDLWFRALEITPNDSEILYWFARAEKEIRDGQVEGE